MSNVIESKDLRAIGFGVLVATGTILGVAKCVQASQEKPAESSTEVVPTAQPLWQWVSKDVPTGAQTSIDQHINLIGATFQAKGLEMFAPSLDIQAKQGGATLLEITKLPPEQQIIPIEQVGFIKRRVPGPNAELFPAYEVIDFRVREIQAIAKARTSNNTTGELESYFLLNDACLVYKMPSNEHNRRLLDVFPAALDIRTQILFPQECWVIERIAPYNWINSANSSAPAKLPSTGRDR